MLRKKGPADYAELFRKGVANGSFNLFRELLCVLEEFLCRDRVHGWRKDALDGRIVTKGEGQVAADDPIDSGVVRLRLLVDELNQRAGLDPTDTHNLRIVDITLEDVREEVGVSFLGLLLLHDIALAAEVSCWLILLIENGFEIVSADLLGGERRRGDHGRTK